MPNTSSVLVCQTASPGTELALGISRDPALGPLLVIGTGGVFIEIFSNGPWCFPRSPSQPLWPYRTGSGSPDPQRRARAVRRDLGAIADAITGLSRLACDLGRSRPWTSTR